MTRTASLLVALLIGLILSSIAKAAAPTPNPAAVEAEPEEAAENTEAVEAPPSSPAEPPVPYQAIIDRNVFNLKPMAPPPGPESLKKPPPEITLTGILTMWGPKRALLEAPVPAKPPEPAKVQSYTLSEGDRDGEIEVLAINEKAGTVKVRNHGIEQVLDFTKNGVKIASAAPAAAGAPETANPSPLGRSGIPRPNAPNPLRNIPRTMRSGPSMPGNVSPNSAPINPNTGMAPAVPQVSSSGFTPEEQEVMIELQREKALQRQDPMATLFPPTQFSQPAPGPEAEEPDIAPQ